MKKLGLNQKIQELLLVSNHDLTKHEHIHTLYAYDSSIILYSNRSLHLNLMHIDYSKIKGDNIHTFEDDGNYIYFFNAENESHLIKINNIEQDRHTINAIFGKNLKEVQLALVRLGEHGYEYFKKSYDALDSYLEKNHLENHLVNYKGYLNKLAKIKL